MKILIHDFNEEFNRKMNEKFDLIIFADGKYAPCLGCFKCWTKTPARCVIRDSLNEISRLIGKAHNLTILTENYYGGFSPKIKNILDRAIGTSTPFSTYRGGQMHHILRYGKHDKFNVFVYGDTKAWERETWKLVLEKNAINEGFQFYEISFIDAPKVLEEIK